MPVYGLDSSYLRSLHERGERERVAGVFEAEDTQQETVHQKEDSTPNKDGDALSLGISHSRHLDSESDGAERK